MISITIICDKNTILSIKSRTNGLNVPPIPESRQTLFSFPVRKSDTAPNKEHNRNTGCPRSLGPIYIVTYNGCVQCMVLMLDGNSEIGAHVKKNLCYLICLRHLNRIVTNRIFILRKDIFSFQHVLSYHLI